MLFFDYVNQWKSIGRVNVSDGWRITQDMMLKNHVLPMLGHLELLSISPSDISRVLANGQSKGHKPNTLKQTYLLMSKIFNDAIHLFEYIEKSPVKKRLHAPKTIHQEADYLSRTEAEKLMEYAKYHWSIQAIVIQIFLGLRAGEVIALKWKDVSFENQTIHIRSKWNRKTKVIDEFPKNGRQVRRPFAGQVKDFLLDLHQTMTPTPENFVCTNFDGSSMMQYHAYQKAIIYLCEGAGIKRISSHAFRHTCSTFWRRAGASDGDIQFLLNHEDAETTKNYLHDDHLRLQKLAALVMTRSSGAS